MCARRASLATIAALLCVCWRPAAVQAQAQPPAVERLPREVFDVLPPPAHVRGAPGTMTVRPQPCRVVPLDQTRRRIVDVAVQEWAFFGFRVVDQTRVVPREAFTRASTARGGDADERSRRRRRPRLPPEEAARVAATIAGYWAVTPDGAWIVERQNEAWKGADGIAARWNAPWSAAFISWVMCEGGLGDTARFRRAIAHHTYIDQAIRTRDGVQPAGAFAAYDVGEKAIAPGDLLCSSRRPAYRTIAERRRQMGVGARSHCDVVVAVDEVAGRILAIGGNVRGTVSLKVMRAAREAAGSLRPVAADGGNGAIFAHLALRAAPIDAYALTSAPTITAVACDGGARAPALLALAAAQVTALAPAGATC